MRLAEENRDRVQGKPEQKNDEKPLILCLCLCCEERLIKWEVSVFCLCDYYYYRE